MRNWWKAALTALLMTIASMLPAAAQAQPVARDVTLDRPGGTLHGTLTLPPGGGAVTVVLFHAGSGPTDRNGNQPGLPNDSLKLLSDGLVAEGFGTLRYDKRAIAASRAAGPKEADLRIGTYVDDLVAWADWLKAQPRVGRVALLGHSEGALIATLAARKTDVSALVLVAGPGEPLGATLRRQLAAQLPPDLNGVSETILKDLEAGRPVADVPAPLAALYRPSLQPYLMSVLPLDPAAELAAVTVPKLVVQGTTDIQVTVTDAERLATVGNARKVLVDGMNHVLKVAPADRAANIAAYMNPALPLAPGVVPGIADFLR